MSLAFRGLAREQLLHQMGRRSEIPPVLKITLLYFQFKFYKLAKRYQFSTQFGRNRGKKSSTPENETFVIRTVLDYIGIKIDKHNSRILR